MEDNGEGVSFCVYVYNVQPGIEIDYATGENHADGTKTEDDANAAAAAVAIPAPATGEDATGGQEPIGEEHTYILNTNSRKFHWPTCTAVAKMSERNKQEFTGTREEVLAMGYEPCGVCFP